MRCSRSTPGRAFTRTFPPPQPRSATGASFLTPFFTPVFNPVFQLSSFALSEPLQPPGLTLATQPKSGDIAAGAPQGSPPPPHAPAGSGPGRPPTALARAGREGKGRERPGREDKEARERERKGGREGPEAGPGAAPAPAALRLLRGSGLSPLPAGPGRPPQVTRPDKLCSWASAPKPLLGARQHRSHA